jgi:hypothetical protein
MAQDRLLTTAMIALAALSIAIAAYLIFTM